MPSIYLPSSTGLDAGSLLQTAASLLWLPQAALLAWALQGVLQGGGLRAVQLPAAGVLLVGIARAVCDACGARRAFGTARSRLSDLRAQVARALAARSPLDRARPASGLAASVMAEQAEAVVPYWTRYHTARLRVVVVPTVILLVVLPLSWVAALVLLCAAPLIPFFMALVGWRAKAESEAQMVEIGGMNAFLLDRLRGLATLRALDAVDATALRLRDAAQALRRRTMAVLRIAFLSSAVLELFSALGVAMVAVYIGFHLLGPFDFGAWGRRLSLGQGFFVLLLTPAFFEPLRELASVWHDRAAGEAALGALHRLTAEGLSLPGSSSVQQAADPTVVAPLACGAPAVDIRDLCFSHAGASRPVLEGYDLHVAPGEHVVVTGASGVGKSTLLALIAGLVPAQGGSISIDGLQLSADTAPALRERMAWISQKPHIFAGTVQSNVALGRASTSAAAVASALRFAALSEVAQAHPGAALGEGGIGLSGGEAVRVALARAAVHPTADLLLADEPTAHLDSETAAQVADALLQLAEGKTLIVATHDPVLAARVGRMGRVVRLAAMRETAA
ncbi:MAG: thiol reductant ABC exporter subunit CydD [Rhodoferax sp.]